MLHAPARHPGVVNCLALLRDNNTRNERGKFCHTFAAQSRNRFLRRAGRSHVIRAARRRSIFAAHRTTSVPGLRGGKESTATRTRPPFFSATLMFEVFFPDRMQEIALLSRGSCPTSSKLAQLAYSFKLESNSS